MQLPGHATLGELRQALVIRNPRLRGPLRLLLGGRSLADVGFQPTSKRLLRPVKQRKIFNTTRSGETGLELFTAPESRKDTMDLHGADTIPQTLHSRHHFFCTQLFKSHALH